MRSYIIYVFACNVIRAILFFVPLLPLQTYCKDNALPGKYTNSLCFKNEILCTNYWRQRKNTLYMCKREEIQISEGELNPENFSPTLPNAMIELYDEFWNLMDKDSNGYVTTEEQKELLGPYTNENHLETQIKEFLLEIDGNDDKVVTIYELQEFLAKSQRDFDNFNSKFGSWIQSLKSGDSSNKIPLHIYNAFKLFDEDLKGRINFKELRLTRVIQHLYISTLWIDSVMKFVDEDGDGKLAHSEFRILNSLQKVSENACGGTDYKKNRRVFDKIDLNSDGYINKEELYEVIQVISNEYPSELNRDTENEYLLQNIESSSGLCPLFWHEFLDKMKKYGKKEIDTAIIEDDFHKWDSNGDKWISFMEYNFLYESDINENINSVRFVEWLAKWLAGSPDNYSNEFFQDFSKQDANNDGIISKGELVSSLQNHRKDYYTDDRVNSKFSRADRNEDGHISMAEYYFLTK